MRAVYRVGVLVWLATFWAWGTSDAQQATTKRQSLGAVTVAVTPIPASNPGEPLKFKVVLDTHSVNLDALKFEEAFALRTQSDKDTPPAAVEQVTGSGHHREAVLVFGAAPNPIMEALIIVAKNIGGVAERGFSWDLPTGP